MSPIETETRRTVLESGEEQQSDRPDMYRAYDWETWYEAADGPELGAIGRTDTQVKAVCRVIEALTGEIPPGVAARAEIYRVDMRNEGDRDRRDLMVAERDAAGAIRWAGHLKGRRM